MLIFAWGAESCQNLKLIIVTRKSLPMASAIKTLSRLTTVRDSFPFSIYSDKRTEYCSRSLFAFKTCETEKRNVIPNSWDGRFVAPHKWFQPVFKMIFAKFLTPIWLHSARFVTDLPSPESLQYSFSLSDLTCFEVLRISFDFTFLCYAITLWAISLLVWLRESYKSAEI